MKSSRPANMVNTAVLASMGAVFRVAGLAAIVSAAGAAGTEQVHLALTERTGEMRVTFVIKPKATAPQNCSVSYGRNGAPATRVVTATGFSYTEGGFDGVIYTGVMIGLTSGNQYGYTVHAAGFKDRSFKFRYSEAADTLNFISYGDMGVKNSWGTAPLVARDIASGDYDMIVNVGDTSYADDYSPETNARIFDQHFNEIEPYASRVPFMTVPGNHEAQFHFAGYLNRLKMPVVGAGPLSPFYYSFDYGPVHFVVYSTEHPFGPGTEQHDFIAADLKAAASVTRRTAVPWIVMWSHRPLYCSDLVTWDDRCQREASEYRDNLEAMMVEAKVDVHIAGHNHQYERSYPVQGCNRDYTSGCIISKSYAGAAAPVHIVNGAAGDVEGSDPTWVDARKAPFRAYHDEGLHTGYSRVKVNRTTFDWTFVYSGDRAIPETNATTPKDAGQIADHFMIQKAEL